MGSCPALCTQVFYFVRVQGFLYKSPCDIPEKLSKIFSWIVPDALSISPLLVPESGLDEKGAGLIIYFSTPNFLLQRSLHLVIWHSQRALFPFILEIWKCTIKKHTINIAQEITLHLEFICSFFYSSIYPLTSQVVSNGTWSCWGNWSWVGPRHWWCIKTLHGILCVAGIETSGSMRAGAVSLSLLSYGQYVWTCPGSVWHEKSAQ